MKREQGYIAFVSILVISAILVTLGIVVTLTSINGIQMSQSRAFSGKALNAVEGCAEEALWRLQDIPALPGSVSTPLLTCTVTVNSQVGNIWNFTVTGTLNGYTKNIRIEAERYVTISINSWQEEP